MKKLLIVGLLLAQAAAAQQTQTITLSSAPAGVRLPFQGIPAVSNTLHIFWHSETASPGEPVSVQGHFPATAQLALAVGSGSNFLTLPIRSQSAGAIVAMLPPTLPVGVYQIWVQAGGVRSAGKFINRAEGNCFDSGDVHSGAPIAIKGRNLFIAGKTPTVRFVSQTTGVSLPATYVPTGSNEFKLNLTAPLSLSLGSKYSVYVSNGAGGTAGEVAVNDTLTAIAGAPDAYGLDVAWSANFPAALTANRYNVKTDGRLTTLAVGNNIADDRAALQGAIDAAHAQASGGEVVLPAGTFFVSSDVITLILRGKVVIRGAGMDLTRIRFAARTGLTFFMFNPVGENVVGLTDLTLEYPTDAVGDYNPGLFKGSNVFLKRVRAVLNNVDWISVSETKHVTIQDCEFTQGANQKILGPTYTGNCEYVTLKNNTLSFVAGGITTNDSRKVFVENNTLIRDMRVAQLPGSIIHLLIAEFTKDAYFANNRYLIQNGLNPFAQSGTPSVQGESLVSEGGGGSPRDLDEGSVSSATLTTLTDANKSWPTTFTRPHVSIIRGRGAGQIRRIVSRTATTLTVGQAWDVTPDATSGYAIYNLGLENAAFVGEEMRGQELGYTLYHNAMSRVDVVGAHLYNSGGIAITPIQGIRSGGVRQFIPNYNVNITGNCVIGGTEPHQGAVIGAHLTQHLTEQPWGTLVTNLRISRNMLIGRSPANVPFFQDEPSPTGIQAYVLPHLNAGAYNNPGQIPFLVGTIIDDNTIKDCATGVFLNSGSYHTSLSRMRYLNVQVPVEDGVISGAGHASVSTTTSN